MAIRDTKVANSVASFTIGEEACVTCSSKNAQAIDLQFLSIDSLPPHHASCNCILEEVQQQLPFTNSADLELIEDKIRRSKHAKFRRCVSKIKARIRSKDPDIDDDILEIQAEVACGHLREMEEEWDAF